MKKIIIFFLSCVFILGTILFSKTYANPIQYKTMRRINLVGLVVDSESLLPLKNVNIYDEKEALIAVTNSDGYFKGYLNYPNNGEIRFRIKIEGDGYYSFVQKENWGNLENNINVIYYFGIKKENTDSNDSNSFSELISNKKDISYNAVYNGFQKIVEKISFNNKIKEAKKGNDYIFFEIDNSFYLINDSGWLKLKSKEDQISINGNKIILATEINSILKRKDVKRMTPSESKDFFFEIYTTH